MQIVSFDFGIKKIGVAVGQTKTRTSSPLEIIFNKNNRINWNSIQSIVEEWRPELILVGKPLNMDGTDSDMMKEVDIFFKKLKKMTNIRCEYVDERLTSFEARQNLIELKTDLVDAQAAKITIWPGCNGPDKICVRVELRMGRTSLGFPVGNAFDRAFAKHSRSESKL